ncbi:MAG: type I restriction endonuclease subunit R [Gammaproteobacteria bacterium]
MSVTDRPHLEVHFEDHIVEYLTAAPAPAEAERWLLGEAAGYDPRRALYPEDVLGWLRESQPEAWARLEAVKGANLERELLDALVRKLADRGEAGGTLEVLRRGFGVAGAGTLLMSQALPADERNATVLARYRANRLRVVRQLRYNPDRAWSIDLVFFLNGLPVATWELKSDFTQGIADAVHQYRHDRSPKAPGGGAEPLLSFRRGALVHFAVSTTEARMCTHLRGEASRFLPFNQGHGGGAGNPPQARAEAGDGGRYPVAYLWEEIFQRDNLLRLIHRFFLFTRERREDAQGQRYWDERMIFPRYHQWRAVTRLDAALRAEGVGRRYLLEHSAGSGKTNTIAWLCHGLIRMHAADGARRFSTVIVVTDRTVLDDQLREAIQQIDHQQGVVLGVERSKGDGRAKSEQLAAALLAATPIVIVTIQTFPHALEAILEHSSLKDRDYAVVIDEAHNSQTGQAASKLRAALTLDDEDELARLSPTEIMARLQQARHFPDNVSYFAFTATPKHSTLTLFGRPDADGKPRSFDHYGMRQAIEEGFILDVLRGYLPYRAARKLAETVEHDQRVDAKRAARSLARWAAIHPSNVSQKVEFIVEHFRRNVAGLLNGEAKAMVVTGSRAQAVMFKRAFDSYIKQHGPAELRALVAFSGTVSGGTDPIPAHYPALADQEFTEANMNAVAGDLREVFDGDEYRVMIVANKFQTGFDQPKLCAMYLDKRVSGVEAVQTLSRLNRTAPGKDTTWVIDFVNDAEEIRQAFLTWYDRAEVSEPQNLDVIYTLKDQLDVAALYTPDEVEHVARLLAADLKPSQTSPRLNAAVAPAVERFNARLKEYNDTIARWENTVDECERRGDDKGAERAEANRAEYARERDGLLKLREAMGRFTRLYEFIAQVVPLGDPELEKLARFLRLYVKRLDSVPMQDIDLSGLAMTHFGIYARPRSDMTLGVNEDSPELTPASGGVSPGRDRARERISDIIRALNELLGEGLSAEDRIKDIANLFAVAENARRDDTVRKQIDAGNSEEQIMQGGDLHKNVTQSVIRMLGESRDQDQARHLLSDPEVMQAYARMVYRLMVSGLSLEDFRGEV